MHVGKFILCLHSHMPYVLSHGRSPHGTDWINESAAECYLPLLDVLRRLQDRGISANWTINLSPILTEQLCDEAFKEDFEAYALAKIEAAKNDAKKFEAEGDLVLLGMAEFWRRWYSARLDEFIDHWNRDIVGAFRAFQDAGCIEIITCAATHGYLPLLASDEAIRAQIELAVESHKKRFDRMPRGIWLPECAYRPAYDWKAPVGHSSPRRRKGIEEFLAESGIEFFFVDSHMIRGGQPLGTYAANFPQLAELFARSSKYFNPPEEERSEYEPYHLPNGVVAFARDPQTTVKVWSGAHGYPGDPYYLEFHKQLYPGRLKYWRVSEQKDDLGRKEPYDPWQAYDRIGRHAADLAATVRGALADYRGATGKEGVLTAMYDTELFGHWWWEGPEFLFELALKMHEMPDLACETAGSVLDSGLSERVITLPEGSWGEGGYHYVWLNDDNAWTWEKQYPLEWKLRDLAGSDLPENVREVVEQAARELLLAQASDWQFLISTYAARDYAEIRFSDHADRCHRLMSLASDLLSGKTMQAEDVRFLRDCQAKDNVFPYLNLDLWKPDSDLADRRSVSLP